MYAYFDNTDINKTLLVYVEGTRATFYDNGRRHRRVITSDGYGAYLIKYAGKEYYSFYYEEE